MNDSHHKFSARLVTLIAAMAGCFAGAAHGQSLSVYGVADVYGQYAKGTRNEVSIESGGLSGSRLGVNASKDLGGGLAAVAKLEAGFSYDNGASGQGGLLFGRQIYVGVTGAFGALTVGRQYSPQFNAIDGNDPFSTGAGSAASSGIVSFYATRANNSVQWVSPTTAGFTTTVLLAAGEASAGQQTDGSLAYLDVHYGAGALAANLTLSGHKKPADDGVNSGAVMLSGSYDFGAVKVLAGAQVVNNATGAADTPDNRREFWAGVNIPVGADTIAVGAGTSKIKDVGGSTASQYSAEYIHSVAKGFDLYGVLTSIKNGNATAYTADSATGAGPQVTAGKTASAAAVGMRYRF
jgi:predicted porin